MVQTEIFVSKKVEAGSWKLAPISSHPMLPLTPESVAVIGASSDETKLGHAVLKNLLTQGYKGKIHAVNPKGGMILKKKAVKSVLAIDGSVDMAVVVTPAATVAAIAEECGKKGVKTLVVISAGFGETGTKEGREAERSLAKTCAEYGMQLVGPNCLGVLRPEIGLNASFAKDIPPAGSIALLTQSGALAVAIMDASKDLHLGYSSIVSMGNKAMLDAPDMLPWCEDDAATKVIGLYVEDVKDGVKLRSAATRIAGKKPIVLLKSGVSQRGKSAVASHTGALAGSDSAIDALCEQAGIRRARTLGEFIDFLRVLSTQPALTSPRVAVVTNAGGPGILATDAAEREGLSLPDMAAKTVKKLSSSLPAAASAKNPVDVLGDAKEDRYRAALEACASDENVDALCVVLTPQVMTPVEDVARAVVDIRKRFPLMPVVACFLGGASVRGGIDILESGGVPNFGSPSAAMRALAALRPITVDPWEPLQDDEKRDDRSSAAHAMLKGRDGYVDELTIQDLFALYDLTVPDQGIAKSADEATALAEQIGYPVIAKVSSPDLPHKTDVGGVKARLMDAKSVKSAYEDIMASLKKHAPTAGVNGVLIQQFLPVGHEMIVGAVRDATFGPLIMVGLGGIYAELMRDTAFRIAPVGEKEAYEMVQSLKAWKLLLGMRGGTQSDVESLVSLLMTVSRIMIDCPQIQDIDVNPVLVSERGCILADVKVRVAAKQRVRLHGDHVPLLH